MVGLNLHLVFMDIRQDFTITIKSELSINYLFIPIARTSKYGLKLIKVNGPKIHQI